MLASALFFNNRKMIFDRISTHRLPAIYQWPEMVHEGGLIGYGPSIVQLYRDVQSRQLLRLLSGAKPADLPVEQPTTFVLVVNLRRPRRSASPCRHPSSRAPMRSSNRWLLRICQTRAKSGSGQ